MSPTTSAGRAGAPASLISPGSVAPAFSLADSPHSRLALDDLRGRPVVLAFYVADWHPVATEQLRQYEELRSTLDGADLTIVGISVDAIWSHVAFADALQIRFPLLSDDEPPGAVARAYGVQSSEMGRSRRALVVIDGVGIVRWSAIFPDAVNPGVDGILSALEVIAADRGPGVSGPRSDQGTGSP